MRKTIMSLILTVLLIVSLGIVQSSAAGGWVDVTTDAAPVRSSASKNGTVVKTYAKGTIIQYTGSTVNSSGNVWLKVSGGYIYSGNVATHKNHVKSSYSVTKSPTCMSTGTGRYTCVCGVTVSTVTLGMVSHSYSTSDYFCKYGCGNYNPSSVKTKSTSSNTLYVKSDAKTHTGPYGNCTDGPTYTKGKILSSTLTVTNGYGNTWYKLSNGYYIVSDYVTVHNSHTYNSGKVTKAATCKATGTKTYTCTLCGATKTEALSMVSHSYSTSDYFCKYGCGSYNPSSVKTKSTSSNTLYVKSDAKTHTGPYGNCTDGPTYTKGKTLSSTLTVTNGYGNTWYKLSNGYYVVSDYVTVHNSHTYNSGKVTKAATCKATGTKTYTCTLCGATKTEAVSKVKHKYDSKTYMCVYGCGSWNPTLKSSAAVSGTRYIVADGKQSKTGPYTDCKVVTTYKKTARVTVTAKVVNQKGSVWYKLSDGSYIFEDNITAHSSHTWNGGTVTKKATCTSNGQKKFTCTFCGATKTESTPVLAHKFDKKTHLCTSGCGKYDPESVTGVSVQKGTYYISKDNAVSRKGPYESCAIVKTYSKGSAVSVTAAVKNAEKNVWYKLSDNSYIYGGNVALPSVKLDASSKNCYKGLTVTLKATTFPSGKAVTWKSSDTSVATVSSTGVVTGKKVGKCTVTALLSLNGKTVTASCTVNTKNLTYTVKFNTNCGVDYSRGSDYTASKKCNYTESFKLPSKPYVRTGRTFTGWATSANGAVVYAPGETVKNLTKTNGATVNLYAVWKNNTVKVYFNANGGYVSNINYNGKYFYNKLSSDKFIIHSTSSSATAKFAQTFTYNTAKCLEDYTSLGLKRKGYTLDSWNTKADGTGTKFKTGTQYSPVNLSSGVKTGNKTVSLYAQWTPITYYIAYNGNGATSGSMAKSGGIAYGKSTKLAANKFKLTNYNFLGWSRSKTGNVEYKNSASVKNLSENKGTVTLYAVWGYTVAYNANGGTGTMNTHTAKKDGTTPTSSCGFTKKGCEFKCWNTRADGKGTDIAPGAALGNLKPSGGKVTLYAKWNPFSPRKTAPVLGSSAYPYSGNGYSSMSGSGNCTWYAFYRAQEILGYCPTALTPASLGGGDAYTWWNAKDKFAGYSSDPLKPKPGAIIVWGGVAPGHVAIVEEVGDDYIVLSESAYGGVWYYNNTPNFNRYPVYNYYGKQSSSYWGSVKCKLSEVANYAQIYNSAGALINVGFTGYIYLK